MRDERIIKQEKNGHTNDCVTITKKNIPVSIDKILYIESNLHKVIYHVLDCNKHEIEYVEYCRLHDAEEMLTGYPFCRIHQSYLINMKYVEQIRRYNVMLSNGRQLMVSKNRYSNAKDQIMNYRNGVESLTLNY